MIMDDVIDCLQRAKNLIKMEGWRQGFSIKDGKTVPGYCALDAISAVNYPDSVRWGAVAALKETLGRTDVAVWNDDPRCGASNVYQLYDDTIARLKAVTEGAT